MVLFFFSLAAPWRAYNEGLNGATKEDYRWVRP